MGFEVVVRPVVFPDIRPAPAQPVLPADDPTKGFATISGNPAKTIQVSESYSSSASSNTRTEVERRSDEVRVFQKNQDKTINKDNFVDMKVPNRIKMKGGDGFEGPGPGWYYYKEVEETDNVEMLRKDIVERPGEPNEEE